MPRRSVPCRAVTIVTAPGNRAIAARWASLGKFEVDPDADFSLPGWIYHDREFFDLEMERVIRPSWQIVCHVSDLPAPGDYMAMDVVGERALVVRGKDGAVRAFHNICRHRGSRLVADAAGVVTGVLLAVARISGETAPLLFTALSNQFWSSDMSSPMASLPVTIFKFAMSPYENWQKLAWAGVFLITAGVLALNILARVLFRQR